MPGTTTFHTCSPGTGASSAMPATCVNPAPSSSDTTVRTFAVTVFATVGFGDIAPVSEPARVLVTIQMIADLLVLGLVVRSMLEAVRRGRSRQSPTPE